MIALSGPVTEGPANAPGAGHHAPRLALLVADPPCPVDVVNDAKMAAPAEYHAPTAQDGEPVDAAAYAGQGSQLARWPPRTMWCRAGRQERRARPRPGRHRY